MPYKYLKNHRFSYLSVFCLAYLLFSYFSDWYFRMQPSGVLRPITSSFLTLYQQQILLQNVIIWKRKSVLLLMQLCEHKEKCVLKATSYERYLLESITSCNWMRFTIIIFLTGHLLYQFPERMEVTLFNNFQRKKNDVLKFLLNYLNFSVLFACLSYLFCLCSNTFI